MKPASSQGAADGRLILGRHARRAADHLRRRDPVLGRLITRSAPCRIPGQRDPFDALARAIVHQQLSMKAAATIWERLAALFPRRRVTPGVLARLDDRRLRACGLSRAKVRYLRDLAAHAKDGRLDRGRLRRLSDDEAIEALTDIKGIGRWSAEMFLIFCLKRPDVWPVDDLGLLKGLQRLYALRGLPSRARALALGERWLPHRTVATWYLWRGDYGDGSGGLTAPR